jgi:hypothetical protein
MRKFILLFASALFLVSCSNESVVSDDIITASVVAGKIGICHNGDNEIVISENAVETHQAHGDAVDRDGDGFYDKENPCSPTDCDDTDPTKTDNCFVIGDDYQGGKIAYIYQPTDVGLYVPGETHGIIAAPSDQSTAAQWGCYGTLIGGTSTAIGTGAANTSAIVSGCAEAGIAAKLCNDLDLNGYSDWYLPSRVELSYLYLNRVAIGGFAIAHYWSSSEGSSNGALILYFDVGHVPFNVRKNLASSVRAVRSF